MPSIDTPHLIEYLYEIGPTLSGAMGESPLTHEELRAWQENTGIELQPWEVRLLLRLSRDYLTESQNAQKRDCLAPYQCEQTAPNLAEVALDLEQEMERLMDL